MKIFAKDAEGDIRSNRKEIEDLRRKLSNFGNNMGATHSNNRHESGDNDEKLEEILERLARIDIEIKNLNSIMAHHDQVLPTKADKKDLQEIEDRILGRLQDLFNEFFGKYSDREETNRSLKNFEKNIKNFVEKSAMNSPRREEEDTAMLAKKPMGGWSCASCEKDLVNISGRAPGYQAWSRLPFRAPGDRIAKVGQGFSKMLALVNPTQTFQQNY